MNNNYKVPKQTNEEKQTKLRHFKMAVDNGELHRLLSPVTFKQKYQYKLLGIVDQALKEKAYDEQHASILSMIYTLIEENRTEDLYTVIKSNFPEYFNK
jgi:F0F1-type ATP synthase delta subunit